MQIALVITLLLVALVLFAIESISVDLITMAILVVLVVAGILSPGEAFAGFSSDIVIILASIFVISGALQKTGLMDALGSHLYRIGRGGNTTMLFMLMTVVAVVSAFMNNTTVTAVFLPPVAGLAKRSGVSPSKLLMPMAFASILGGTCTLVGTSTNVAVSGYLARVGMEPLSLFEFTAVGVTLALIGIVYLTFVGRRLLPADRGVSQSDDYGIRQYLSEIVVHPKSPWTGESVFRSELSRMNFRILQVVRGKDRIFPTPETTIREGDVLLVEGNVSDLMKVKDVAGIDIKALARLDDAGLQSAGHRVAEAMLMPQSDLVDRTLKEANFRERFAVTALALYRHGHSLCDKIGHIRLHIGDVLLLFGNAERIAALRRNPGIAILGEVETPRPRQKRGLVTVLCFGLAMALGSAGVAPLSICLLAASILTMLMRAITVEEAYQFIDWRLIILIAGMMAFGIAMEKSGTADYLAGLIVHFLQPHGPTAILAGFLLLTVLLTQPMSNAATALVVLPVALSTAETIGANGRTFAIAIMLAASVSLVAPFEPSCILVYGPGKYRFRDFIKVGLPLTVLAILIILVMVPYLWPLFPAGR